MISVSLELTCECLRWSFLPACTHHCRLLICTNQVVSGTSIFCVNSHQRRWGKKCFLQDTKKLASLSTNRLEWMQMKAETIFLHQSSIYKISTFLLQDHCHYIHSWVFCVHGLFQPCLESVMSHFDRCTLHLFVTWLILSSHDHDQ